MARPSRKDLLCIAAFLVFASAIQFSFLRSNPPGFFIDESSIAYNAHTIATTGSDEHGEPWPLFFRAFGEFKNPVYIYLLAGLYRITGPSILAARGLSAAAGLLTALLLGVLATQITRSRTVGLVFAVFALLTPWLFELSRLVMEVAIYPLVMVLFLLGVWNASQKTRWGVLQILALSTTLALLTYTYSIGRLLAPLLAIGLVFFITRTRLLSLFITWILYASTLIPLLVFNQRHPDALTIRFRNITYMSKDSSSLVLALEFLRHFFANLNPLRLFVSESSKVSEIVHIPGPPALLTITALLLIAGIIAIMRKVQFKAWWCFIAYALAVSIVPSSLTNDDFHLLRLAPLPVLLLVITTPAFNWLVDSESTRQKIAIMSVLFPVAAQGLWFQWEYHLSATSPRRLHTFDADYTQKILPAALNNSGSAPIYLADNSARPGYIQALWYGTLQGIPLKKFVSLGFDRSAPEGAVVITTEQMCPRCRVLAENEPYTTYIAQGPPRALSALRDEQMRAELTVANAPVQMNAGQQVTIEVAVRNVSTVDWLTAERSNAEFRISVGNHWFNANGSIFKNDDGRATLPRDLHPGESLVMPLTINTPNRVGNYILEVDLLQENVSWFGVKGSHTWRGSIRVE